MIQDDIKEKLKDAMKAKDEVTLTTLRSLLSAFTNELVAQKKTPQDILDDKSVLAVITKEAKKRKDSIAQFEEGGRNDLAESEKKELAILEEYLPEQMSEAEIQSLVIKKKEELGISDKTKMGMLMGAIMKETGGNTDGTLVKKLVEDSF